MITQQSAALAELVRFLIARINDDEAELSRLHREQLRGSKPVIDLPGVRAIARQRAECDAKRRLVAQAQHLLILRDLPSERDVRNSAAQILHAMAAPYRDHRGFRPEWYHAAASA